jgi:hypothetical protein
VILIAWLTTKMVHASTSVESDSSGVNARKKATSPATMQSQINTLSAPAAASRRGERSDANPFKTEAAKVSTKVATRAGNRVAPRSMMASVASGCVTIK